MRRRLIFLLSSVLNDFDSYLPLVIALQGERRNWSFEFITFDRGNYESILANPTLATALQKFGFTLRLLDANRGGRTLRKFATIWAFFRLYLRIWRSRHGILVHGRQFTDLPYALAYLLIRAVGGTGLLLMRGRQPDDTIKLAIRERFDIPEGAPSLVERLFKRDADALLCYHDNQELLIKSLHRFGRTSHLQRITVGLPNLWQPWQDFVSAAADRARDELAAAGAASDEIFTVLAPKSISSQYMRRENAGQDVFLKVLNILTRSRPRATVLVRPHPRAIGEPWFRDVMSSMGGGRVQLSLLHPDVLIRLSKRVIAPNTSTLMSVSDNGRFIDCTDYPPDHYETLGEHSICDGYGVAFVNPSRDDFEEKFVKLLDDDAWPDNEKFVARRNALCTHNPPGPNRFLELVENRPNRAALAAATQESVTNDA